MKHFWMAVVVAGALASSAAAQTGANGSASTSGSATAGKTGVATGANANAQVSGNSASADAGAQADASKKDNKGSNTSSTNAGSSTGASGNAGGTSLNAGTTLQAELTKSVDAKKAKPGDEITAKATQDVKSDGKVVVRKGSKLIGHVTEAQARSKENAESKLGLVFDRAVLKDGSEVTFNAVVQALAVVQTAPLSSPTDMGMSGSSAGSGGGGRIDPMGGGPVGGVTGEATSTIGSTVGNVTSTTGAAAGSATGTVGGVTNGSLTSNSRGVFGLKGITLSSATSGGANAQTSVLSSTTQTVKLDSGTQMVLQVSSPQR